MPTPLMKSLAKKAHKKSKTVEKLWNKAERLVKKKYEIEEDSSRFYPLVVGVLKNFLDIEDKEEIKEDDIGGIITTADMGDYTFADKIGAPVQRMINDAPNPVSIEITKKKRKVNKKYAKSIKKIWEKLEDEEMDLDDAMSDMIKYFCERNSEDPIDDSINALNRFLGIVPSIFDME